MSPLAKKKNKKKKSTKKKKQSPTTTPTPQPTADPSLPNDLILSCLARVSRFHYPALSLVSKSFRSLFASPELYKDRSLLGHTESCLYVCLWDYSDQKPRWFNLCRKSNKTLTNDTSNKKSSGYVLAKVPIPHSPSVSRWGQGLVAIGSSIYNIVGSRSYGSVSVLDCTSHTWKEAPVLPVKLGSLTASVVGNKIYVAGDNDGDIHTSKEDSIQVLDTKTQIWDLVPISCSERNCNFYSQSACVDGNFHKTLCSYYNVKESRWDLASQYRYSDVFYCTIENVLYSVSFGGFTWYDTKGSKWRDLKGLVGLPEFHPDTRLKLADYGVKMAVLWKESLPGTGGRHTMIWCAEIALERRENSEIWGKVEWFDHVLTIPGKCDVLKGLGVTV